MERTRRPLPKNKMKKALVLDIDGTLTNSRKEITPATRLAIIGLLKRGQKVILASGRPTPGMRRYVQELELEKYGGYLLSFNGARIVDCHTGEVIYERFLPLSLLPGLYRFAEDKCCGLITYLGNEIISAFPPDRYVELTARINGLSVRIVENFLEFVDFGINKCLMTAEPEKAQHLEEELRQQCSGAGICRSNPYFIEIVPKDVDKAVALAKILPMLGITRENTVCCGDSFNDLPMIKYAGVGVAMGNAQQPVKDAADYVTASNDEDGLLEVIERFF